MKLPLKPVGSRPHCLFCGRELAPNYKREFVPLAISTGRMTQVRDPQSYGRSEATFMEVPETRAATDEERKQFRKDNPPQFEGTYGRYRDNRFCGLNCGYRYALRVTNLPKF